MLAIMIKDASKENRDRPGVIAPPPVIYLSGVGLGLGAHAMWPLPLGLGGAGVLIGGAVIGFGFLLMMETFLAFRRAKTSVNPYEASSAIVFDGPFGISRNPIYGGMTLVLVGLAGVFDTYWALLSLALVLPVMRWGVIAREELYLEAKFGDDYRRYKQMVRRWI